MGAEITNLSGVMRFLSVGVDRIERAGLYALGQVALAVERQAKQNFDGKWRQDGATAGGYARWVSDTPGITHIPSREINGHQVPNVRSGNLRRSIGTVITPKGLGKYEATVQPGMIYARRVEVEYGYQFMRPARAEVARQADRIFTDAFRRKMGY